MTMIQKRRFQLNMITSALLALLAMAPLLAYRAVARGQASQPAGAPALVVAKAAAAVPSVAPLATAQPAAPSSLQVLLDTLLKLVGLAGATAVPLLLRRWLGAKVSTETLAQLTELATQGVGAAEEAAHQAVKRGLAKPSGSEKLEVAAKYVVETADRLGLGGVAQATVKTMIESRLGSTRA